MVLVKSLNDGVQLTDPPFLLFQFSLGLFLLCPLYCRLVFHDAPYKLTLVLLSVGNDTLEVLKNKLFQHNSPDIVGGAFFLCAIGSKVPYNPRTGGRAQSTNPATFTPLDVALAALERDSYSGIGVGLFGNLGAIDIDHCINEAGELSPMAYDIMDTMQAYTEYSPSGKGLTCSLSCVVTG